MLPLPRPSGLVDEAVIIQSIRASQIWDSRFTNFTYLPCVRSHNVKGLNKSHPGGREPELIRVLIRQ